MKNNNGMREWKELEPNILLKFSACSTFSSFCFHLENLDIKKAEEKVFLYSLKNKIKFPKKRGEEQDEKIDKVCA